MADEGSVDPGRGVVLLLATYNGAAFLPEQLDSLAAQTHRPLRLIVRDDGSTDDTRAMVEAFAARAPFPVTLLPPGPRLGATGSFLALLEAAPANASYVAFADQDDVWAPDKVAAGAARLAEEVPESTPGLLFGRLRITDAALQPRSLSPPPRRPVALGNVLVESLATGCTVILNRAARAAVLRLRPADARPVIAHDWWCALVVAALGRMVYDPEPRILYRQHQANAIGMPRTPVARLLFKIRAHLSGGHAGVMAAQVAALRAAAKAAGPEALPPEAVALIDAYLMARRRGPLGRLAFALSGRVWRQSRHDDLAYKLLFVLGRG